MPLEKEMRHVSRTVVATLAIALILMAGCGKPEPTATQRPVPPTPQAEAQEHASTPIAPPPTRTPTETPIPPKVIATPTEPRPTTAPVEEITSQSRHFGVVEDQPIPGAEGKPPVIVERMVDVGGHQLFIRCVGAGTPTVVMEAGWNDVRDTWSLVQAEVAEHTRACAYDRAGLGHSEPGPEPRTIVRVVGELHTLLENADIQGPYIVVGHSWGGLSMRLFADRYPEEVVGLILVDSSHPDVFRRNAAVLPPASPDDSETIQFYRAWFANTIDDPTLEIAPELFEAGSLGDLPLVVLTAMNKQRGDDFPADLNAQFNQIWLELQEALARLSSNSTHIVSQESVHFIQQEQPDLVIDAILQVIEAARAE